MIKELKSWCYLGLAKKESIIAKWYKLLADVNDKAIYALINNWTNGKGLTDETIKDFTYDELTLIRKWLKRCMDEDKNKQYHMFKSLGYLTKSMEVRGLLNQKD